MDGKQLSFADIAADVYDAEDTKEYDAFVEKFKPKRTTDDCYTPPLVYDAVLDYCIERYNVDPSKVIRPFYPGGDYENYQYPAGCVVIDNPPFSIITKICAYYVAQNIHFFLFAPYLTNFCIRVPGITHIFAPHKITYENGAKVNTCFVTNLEPGVFARADPILMRRIRDADEANLKAGKEELPKYAYPANVLTGTMLGYLATHSTELTIAERDVCFIRRLDSQCTSDKAIFGGGYLLSDKAAADKAAADKAAADKAAAEKAAAEKAAAEKAAAITWELSDRELEIIAGLGDRA